MILLDLLDQCMKLSSLLFCKCASLCSVSLVGVWWVCPPHHMTILSMQCSSVWRLGDCDDGCGLGVACDMTTLSSMCVHMVMEQCMCDGGSVSSRLSAWMQHLL